jgi:enoyl-CoA hydratase/carnithine racemase
VGLPLVDDEDGIRTITLNRPEVLNAITLDDLAAIARAVREPGPGIRALILTGAGDRAFSSGMHIATFSEATRDAGREIIEQVGACIAAIRLSPLLTVAMINGYCLGAAFEMALACDLRVAHENVRFGLPEVKLGVPSVVEASLLQHHIGLSKAKELILTGELYAASDLPRGLVNRTALPNELRTVTKALIRAIVASTPEVIAAQKSLFETWLNRGVADGIEVSKQVFGHVFELPATGEAIERYRHRPG